MTQQWNQENFDNNQIEGELLVADNDNNRSVGMNKSTPQPFYDLESSLNGGKWRKLGIKSMSRRISVQWLKELYKTSTANGSVEYRIMRQTVSRIEIAESSIIRKDQE